MSALHELVAEWEREAEGERDYYADALRACAKRLRAALQQAAEPVGEAETMPGANGFTMAVFSVSDVPVGTKLYIAPPVDAAAMLALADEIFRDGAGLVDVDLATPQKRKAWAKRLRALATGEKNSGR